MRQASRLASAPTAADSKGDQFIGWTMHTELENMVMAGITPAQVLVAATRTSAEILGQDDLGTVAPGKSADFVVLDANPLEDITNTRKIGEVYLGGVRVDRAAQGTLDGPKGQMTMSRLLMFGALIVMSAILRGQSGARGGEWPTYGGDLGNTRYSPLDQINAENFSTLEVAWRFKTDNLGPRPEFKFESTPLMVNGRLFSTAGTRRAVVALDAATGELLWMHSEQEGARGRSGAATALRPRAGLLDRRQDERILYVTPGIAWSRSTRKTGQLVTGFGRNGIVDLKLDFDQKLDLDDGAGRSPLHAPRGRDVVIVGAAFETGANPKSKTNVKGYIRGFDVRTGKRLWIFHTIPRPGEFGNDTWLNDSWSYTGNTGVWAQISADEELGLAYLPIELPTHDYYGGARPGNNLFSESIVAVDLRTGQRKWHYQLVHHGMWDMDIPAPPILTDINVNGRTIKALAQPTKQAFLYVFNRETGKPIWPIEERPVAEGRHAGRMVFADAAASDQAAGLRRSGSDSRRFDRLHARASR